MCARSRHRVPPCFSPSPRQRDVSNSQCLLRAFSPTARIRPARPPTSSLRTSSPCCRRSPFPHRVENNISPKKRGGTAPAVPLPPDSFADTRRQLESPDPFQRLAQQSSLPSAEAWRHWPDVPPLLALAR